MGSPITTVLSLASTFATLRSDSQQRKQQRADAFRRQRLLQLQYAEQKRDLEKQKKQQASALRAHIGASGISIKSNSAKALLQGLQKRNIQSLNTLSARNSLNQANLLETPSNRGSHLISFLRNLQRIG